MPDYKEQVWKRIRSRYMVTANGCWEWTGRVSVDGYSRISYEGREDQGHRVVLKLLGISVAGLEVDHLCRNRGCVNPDHLEPVTKRENIMRSDAAGAIHARKTHCIHGHEFSPDNTRICARGWRHCLICKAANDASRGEARRQADSERHRRNRAARRLAREPQPTADDQTEAECQPNREAS